jgi:hypothetical protein
VTDTTDTADSTGADHAEVTNELADAAVAETDVTDVPQPDTLREYMQLVYVRIRSGDSGVLPVVAGLILISVLFQSIY